MLKRDGCTLARPPVSSTPSTVASSVGMSVISGTLANISGSAPATSATARKLRSPAICAGNLFSARCVFAITPTTGLVIRPLLSRALFPLIGAESQAPSRPSFAQILERLAEAPERLLEDRARGREVEAQPT